MVRRWKKEIERYQGTGTLRDSAGKSAEVPYLLVVQQNMRERSVLRQPTEVVGGSRELSGSLVLGAAMASLNIENNLFLALEDGKEVEIILTQVSDPWSSCPFVVAKAKDFFGEE